MGKTVEDLRNLVENNDNTPTKEKKNQVPEHILAPTRAETKNISNDKLKKIDNIDFLRIQREYRLPHITKDKVKTADILSGDVKQVEFTFTFEGKFNKDLYLDTTAGQAFSKDIAKVSLGGEVFSRAGVIGEFFNEDGERLIIKEGTKVEIEKIYSENELFGKKTENEKKVIAYLEAHEGVDKDIVTQAMERDIDIDFALIVFSEIAKEQDKDLKNRKLEYAFTDFDRLIGDRGLTRKIEGRKYESELVLPLLKKYHSDKFMNVAKNYGITIEQIDTFEKKENQSTNNKQKVENIDIKGDFKQKTKILAKEIERVYGIPWLVTCGQAAIESGWGKSKLARESQNYFGIKSFGTGKSRNYKTREVINGKSVYVNAGFRENEDMKASFINYAEFLTRNKRYRNAFKYGENGNYDPKKFIQEVAKAGYATDPKYASKVQSTFSHFV